MQKHLLTAFAVSRCFSVSLCSVSIQTLSRRVHTPEFQRFFRCNFRAVLIEGDRHLSGTLKLCQLFFRKCQFFFQSGCHIIRIYHNKAPFQSWSPVGLRSVASRLFSHHLFWSTVLFFILPQSYAFRKPLRRLPISKIIDKEM